jgi:methyl-accepting chemotaxis protein
MALFGNKAIQSRTDEAVKIIDKMAAGDFTGHIETSGSGVVAPIMWALIYLFYILVKQGEYKWHF